MGKDIDLSEIESIIEWYFASNEYITKVKGIDYYAGKHDILKRKRTMIGEGGNLQVINNLPNNKLIDNQYKKLVKQKVNYLMSKTPSITTENEIYNNLLNNVFSNDFLKIIKRIATDVYNTGIGYIYVYINNAGELKFKKLNSLEIIPVWKDNEHSELKCAIRVYKVDEYSNGKYEEKYFCEIYTINGIEKYSYKSGKLKFIEHLNYLTVGENQYNWQKIPLVVFKSDELEQPLITRVKSLQDSLNELISDFSNNMQEDNRNTILVIKNYEGTRLDEFRQNLATFGAVKVREDGDVSTLKIDVNGENYDNIVKLLKKTIIENGGGFDSKSDILGHNPNQLNIRSMYSDIDLEANEFEVEFKASFEELLWFVSNHLKNTGQGDFKNEKVEIILNRDILVNESQAIQDIKNSVGIISQRTLLEQHPWVKDIEIELDRLKETEENIYGEFEEHNHSYDVDE